MIHFIFPSVVLFSLAQFTDTGHFCFTLKTLRKDNIILIIPMAFIFNFFITMILKIYYLEKN